MTEKDYLTDPSFDPADLESKLNEIEADVNSLISNLPVEAIDDDEEWEEEYPGDFEDSSGCGPRSSRHSASADSGISRVP